MLANLDLLRQNAQAIYTARNCEEQRQFPVPGLD